MMSIVQNIYTHIVETEQDSELAVEEQLTQDGDLLHHEKPHPGTLVLQQQGMLCTCTYMGSVG